MKSIQGRLIALLCGASVVLLVATGWLIYDSVGSDLVRQFDRSLQAQAAALGSLVTLEPGGHVDFEYNDAAMPQYQRGRHPEYFIIYDADGRIVAQSKSLAGRPAPRVPAGARAVNLRLPDGHAGRALRMDFVPQPDPDAKPGTTPAFAAAAPFSVIVARHREPLEDALERLLSTLAIAGAALAACIATMVILVVRRTLQPLRKIRDSAAAIEPSRLDLRLPAEELPTELAPICTCLNDLLERLDAAFARERRFSSDIAHELRTPIAELRSVTEVALKHLNDPALAQEACRDADAIARQMQTLVNTLLALGRPHRMSAIQTQPVLLRQLVENTHRELGGDDSQVDVEIPEDATVEAEPALLSSTLRNLLSNALEYRQSDSVVRCTAGYHDEHWTLIVENATDHLTGDDLPHVFEPFWRKDTSRTDSAHAGLGLSLVQAYCKLMNIEIQAQLPESHLFRIVLHFCRSTTGIPAESSSPSSFDHLSVLG